MALISAGADVNAGLSFVSGLTPLYKASEAGNAETVRALIAAGANPNTKDPFFVKHPCTGPPKLTKPK
jgi:ankyrin repeat protein